MQTQPNPPPPATQAQHEIGGISTASGGYSSDIQLIEPARPGQCGKAPRRFVAVINDFGNLVEVPA